MTGSTPSVSPPTNAVGLAARVRELGQTRPGRKGPVCLRALAIAARIHGDSSRVTRSFEQRFTTSLKRPSALRRGGRGVGRRADALMDANVGPAPTQAKNATEGSGTDLPTLADVITPSEGRITRSSKQGRLPPVAQVRTDTQTAPPALHHSQPKCTPRTRDTARRRGPAPSRPVGNARAGRRLNALPAAPPALHNRLSRGGSVRVRGGKTTSLHRRPPGRCLPAAGHNGTGGCIARRLPVIERMRTEAGPVLMDAETPLSQGLPVPSASTRSWCGP
jgi:hypothetical protein